MGATVVPALNDVETAGGAPQINGGERRALPQHAIWRRHVGRCRDAGAYCGAPK